MPTVLRSVLAVWCVVFTTYLTGRSAFSTRTKSEDPDKALWAHLGEVAHNNTILLMIHTNTVDTLRQADSWLALNITNFMVVTLADEYKAVSEALGPEHVYVGGNFPHQSNYDQIRGIRETQRATRNGFNVLLISEDVVLVRNPFPVFEATSADLLVMSQNAVPSAGGFRGILEDARSGFQHDMAPNALLFVRGTPPIRSFLSWWGDAAATSSFGPEIVFAKLLRHGRNYHNTDLSWGSTWREAGLASGLLRVYQREMVAGVLSVNAFWSALATQQESWMRTQSRGAPIAVNTELVHNADFVLREAGLKMHTNASKDFMIFDFDLPELTVSNNMRLKSSATAFWADVVSSQLSQLHSAVALCRALGRTLVLPPFISPYAVSLPFGTQPIPASMQLTSQHRNSADWILNITKLRTIVDIKPYSYVSPEMKTSAFSLTATSLTDTTAALLTPSLAQHKVIRVNSVAVWKGHVDKADDVLLFHALQDVLWKGEAVRGVVGSHANVSFSREKRTPEETLRRARVREDAVWRPRLLTTQLLAERSVDKTVVLSVLGKDKTLPNRFAETLQYVSRNRRSSKMMNYLIGADFAFLESITASDNLPTEHLYAIDAPLRFVEQESSRVQIFSKINHSTQLRIREGLKVLRLGYDVLLLDVHAMFLETPFPLFSRHLDADILIAPDAAATPPRRKTTTTIGPDLDDPLSGMAYRKNTGCVFLRSRKEAIAFVSNWVHAIEAEEVENEQRETKFYSNRGYAYPPEQHLFTAIAHDGPWQAGKSFPTASSAYSPINEYKPAKGEALHTTPLGAKIGVLSGQRFWGSGMIEGAWRGVEEGRMMVHPTQHYDPWTVLRELMVLEEDASYYEGPVLSFQWQLPEGLGSVAISDLPSLPWTAKNNNFWEALLLTQLAQIRSAVHLAEMLQCALVLPPLISPRTEKGMAPSALKRESGEYGFSVSMFLNVSRLGVAVKEHSFLQNPRVSQKLRKTDLYTSADQVTAETAAQLSAALATQKHLRVDNIATAVAPPVAVAERGSLDNKLERALRIENQWDFDVVVKHLTFNPRKHQREWMERLAELVPKVRR